MKVLMVIWSLGESDEERRRPTAQRERSRALIKHLFALGPAWMAAGSAVLVATEQTTDAVRQGLRSVVKDYDNVFLVDVTGASDVLSVGVPADEEGLTAIFPGARAEWW